MIAEFKVNSILTLLETIIKKIGLVDGDLIDISEHDGGVTIKPVKKIPKKYITTIDGVKKEFSTKEEYRKYLETIYGNLDEPDSEEPPKMTGTHEEFMQAMIGLAVSIDDPTFVEPPEIDYESPREVIIWYIF